MLTFHIHWHTQHSGARHLESILTREERKRKKRPLTISSVRFPRNINIKPLHPKRLYKILPKSRKIRRKHRLIRHRQRPLGRRQRKTRAQRLINPHHIRQIGPGKRVRLRPVRAILPKKGPVFLEQAHEGTAPWSAVEPDGDFIGGEGVGGGEEPKEEFVGRRVGGSVEVVGDGESAGVGLADVKVDFWDAGAVYNECCCSFG